MLIPALGGPEQELWILDEFSVAGLECVPHIPVEYKSQLREQLVQSHNL